MKRDFFGQGMISFMVLLLVVGFLMRFDNLNNNLFFSYEQGRDILAVKKIADGKLTLIGPRTSIEGVFHGPFYYYLLLPFYFLFSGNPLGMMAPFLLLGVGCLYLAFLVGKSFFNQRVGVMAALFYGFSFGAIVYSRWFSHPPLASFFSLLLFHSFYRLIEGDERFSVFLIMAFAGLIQTEIVAGLFLLPALVLIWLWFRPKIKNPKIKMINFLVAAFSLLPYVLFDLRHQFLVTRNIFRFILNKENFYRPSFLEALKTIFDRYLKEFELMVLPVGKSMALAVLLSAFLLLALNIKKSGLITKKSLGEKMLVLWLISAPPLGLFIWGGFHLKHYLVGVAPGMIIAAAFLTDWLMARRAFRWLGGFLLAAVLMINLFRWSTWLPANKNVFYSDSQLIRTLGQELKVIDNIYQKAAGNEFSYQAWTVPNNMEHAWEYLFWWHGQRQYNYLPAHSSDQTGLYYLILEPGGDRLYRQDWKKEKTSGKKLLETFELGEVIIESYHQD